MKILVIDDEEMIRNLAKRILTRAGHEVLLAENGNMGLELFNDNKDSVSLVIVDMFMDGLSGIETIQKINEIQPDLLYVLSSGNNYSSEEIPEELISKVNFLQKPYRASQLTDKINEVLHLV